MVVMDTEWPKIATSRASNRVVFHTHNAVDFNIIGSPLLIRFRTESNISPPVLIEIVKNAISGRRTPCKTTDFDSSLPEYEFDESIAELNLQFDHFVFVVDEVGLLLQQHVSQHTRHALLVNFSLGLFEND